MAFKKFTKEEHLHMPLVEALTNYSLHEDVLPFDVPGHKKGAADHPLKDILGRALMRLDVNSMKQLDLISNPTGVIKEAEALFADLYDADEAFFLINGSTSGIHNMLLSALSPGDKIILPRNVHKSAVTGLVLSGGLPVYMHPAYHKTYGISTNVTAEEAIRVMDENPDAKAIFLINPTYFGATTDMKKIIEYAHRKGLAVLVDEAHGALLPFSDQLPPSAAELGADLVTISTHKTAGSFTQSSLLLHNRGLIPRSTVRSTLNLMQSTSASYLLMASLDGARYELAKKGHEKTEELVTLSKACIDEINKIDGLLCFSEEEVGREGVDGFDSLKLVINVRGIGLTGFEAYDLLREHYQVQMELAETYVVLGIVGIGDDRESLQGLVDALRKLARDHRRPIPEQVDVAFDPVYPEVCYAPRDAFYEEKDILGLEDALGAVAGESLMIYPPGIPVVMIGEKITEKIIEQYKFLHSHNRVLLGNEEAEELTIKVIKER